MGFRALGEREDIRFPPRMAMDGVLLCMYCAANQALRYGSKSIGWEDSGSYYDEKDSKTPSSGWQGGQ
jgi:hypothetical protein